MQDQTLRFHGTSTVATTMINYIRDFFGCRDCAENFSRHVASISLPQNADQSLIWLWSIHNMANVELAGDPTEVDFINQQSVDYYYSGSPST